MSNIDKALAEISDIHAQMAAGRMFRGFGPAVVALTGLFAALLTFAQILWPEALASNDLALLGWWVFAALLSVLFITIEMLALSRRHHGGLADSMILQVVQTFLPIGGVGAIVALVISLNRPDLAVFLPGLWQLLVALAVFGALKFLPREIAIPAGWYLVAGTVTLLMAARGTSLSPWMMGLPFAIGQWLMALTLHKTLEAAHAGR